MNKAIRIIVKGVVQGVGFRPFIYRLATNLDLKGLVFNSSEGVIIEIEGEERNIEKFLEKISTDAPPLSKIDKIEVRSISKKGLESFKIKESLKEEGKFIPISPDIGTCQDCLRELFSAADRRYRYPFINCTNCGPRWTIVRDIPYDRQRTTMDMFKMCPDCKREYLDQSDRRYHAQPNACQVCGPEVELLRSDGSKVQNCQDPIKKAVTLLKEGHIVAIKGLGGFHLACDATNDEVVLKLRKRKMRERSKPLAVMLSDLTMVRQYCQIDDEEECLLTSPQRPIVLLKKRPDCQISTCVAPNNNYLGIMLPYTPLHHLLFQLTTHNSQLTTPLVMTSGNPSDEPLTKDNDEAVKRLGSMADYLLGHNRDIHISVDDSVISKNSVIRRSRGYAPSPITLKFKLGQILGVGAELKNTFCLTKENYAFISQHIGDLNNYETLNYYQKSLNHFKRLFSIEPEIIAHDLHPDYLSTKFALEYCSLLTAHCLLPVQHHHAHIVSCLAENGIEEPVIGVAMDGIGYGTDGRMWGGEFLVADYLGFERAGHLKNVPMPGGDKASREPYRMALSYLHSVYQEKIPACFLERWDEKKVLFILKMIKQEINSPLTSSAGRLFDAVSSILGIRDVIDYEAQAAIELEMIIDSQEEGRYGFEVKEEEGIFVIDLSLTIAEIVQDLDRGIGTSIISSKFHNTVAAFILDICQRIRGKTGIEKVALSGGVFQNRYLLEKTKVVLLQERFVPILHHQVPPNDGGISLGQAVIAGKKRIKGNGESRREIANCGSK